MYPWSIWRLFLALALLISSYESIASPQHRRDDLKNRYDSIEVAPFTVRQGIDLPAEYMQSMMASVFKNLRRTQKFKHVLTQGDAEPSDSGRIIHLLGVVTQYKHGGRGKRLIAIGLAGDTKVVAHVKFLDKATGEVLVEADVDGVIYTGFLGGSPKGAPSGIGKDIAKIAKKLFFS